MATVTGGSNDDTLNGTSGDDRIDGRGGDDTLDGGAGNDTLTGGPGNDSLIGGTGFDYADYSGAPTGVNADLGSGTASGDGTDTLTGIEGLYGSSYNDTLTGDGSDNALRGGAGDDALYGGAGNDTLEGGAGADTLDGGTGMDYADYSNSAQGVSIDLGNWTASGGDATGDQLAGIDGVYGSSHDDTLIGYDQQGTDPSDTYTNVFYGGAGSDYIDGRGGEDSLYGGADSDTILGGGGNDVVDGGSGDDLLYGGDGSDTLYGGDGNDTLYGGAGGDSLAGGAGNDVFYAGPGDTIDGGAGDQDTLNLAGDYRFIHDSTDPSGLREDIVDGAGDTVGHIDRNAADPQSGTVTFTDAAGNPTSTLSFSNIEHVVPCFTAGTLIDTLEGRLPVEALEVGDRVLTRDNGYLPLRWIGRKPLDSARLRAEPALRPVLIRKGALGDGCPDRDMMVSRQHRMLVHGARAELMFGEAEVLVRALHLVGLPGVTEVMPAAGVTYVHQLFDRHEIVLADGAWSESYQPGDRSLAGFDADQRAELFAIFPELARQDGPDEFEAARLTLKAHEARVLLPRPAAPVREAIPAPARVVALPQPAAAGARAAPAVAEDLHRLLRRHVGV